jgi:hypothetical protein
LSFFRQAGQEKRIMAEAQEMRKWPAFYAASAFIQTLPDLAGIL